MTSRIRPFVLLVLLNGSLALPGGAKDLAEHTSSIAQKRSSVQALHATKQGCRHWVCTANMAARWIRRRG